LNESIKHVPGTYTCIRIPVFGNKLIPTPELFPACHDGHTARLAPRRLQRPAGHRGRRGPYRPVRSEFAEHHPRAAAHHARERARRTTFRSFSLFFLSRSTRHPVTPSLAPRSDVLRVSPRVVQGGLQHASSSIGAVEAIARPIMTPLSTPPARALRMIVEPPHGEYMLPCPSPLLSLTRTAPIL